MQAQPAPHLEGQRAREGTLRDFQRAMLNILEDSEAEKRRLETVQTAMLNILEDFAEEKSRFTQMQTAMLNILDDSDTEKMRLEQSQRAFLNILEDIDVEKSKVTAAYQDIETVNVELQTAVSELDAFSYSVSHDLRAPLRAIDGFSRILLKQFGPALSEEPREYLRLVRDNAAQMGHLVDDLLAFSRLGRTPLNKRQVATGTIIEQVLCDARQQAEGRCVSVSVGETPPLWGDPGLLKQVFANLIQNAFKYTRTRAEAVIGIGSSEIGGERVFFIRDNGAGFDMQYADKLFGVFQRLHRVEDFEGTGVGLAIVQRIIQRHGGRVWAEAAVDKGATFYFTTELTSHV
jgi:light-regulated signal transduction histidine kinase (bacteriophytochrome)